MGSRRLDSQRPSNGLDDLLLVRLEPIFAGRRGRDRSVGGGESEDRTVEVEERFLLETTKMV